MNILLGISFYCLLTFQYVVIATGFNGCGRLEERLLNNNEWDTAPTEMPFHGRIFYKDAYNNTNFIECVAPLISRRYLLAPADCLIEYSTEPTDFVIELGLWQNTDNIESYHCSKQGYCVPPPKRIPVSNLVIHPYYDKITTDNNIALLTLATDIEFTNYIQPLCVKAAAPLKSVIAHYFDMAGYVRYTETRSKTGVTTVSRRYYDKVYNSILPPYTRTQFVGNQEMDDKFYPGTALLGQNVYNEVPRSFYIVGFMVKTADTRLENPVVANIYQEVQPFMDWIRNNTGRRRNITRNTKSDEENTLSSSFIQQLFQPRTDTKGDNIVGFDS